MAGVALIQQFVAADAFGTTPSTFSGRTAPTTGQGVLAIVRANGASGTATLSDGTNTFTPRGTGGDGDGGPLYYFTATNVSGSPTGYTFTWSGGGSALPELALIFIDGLDDDVFIDFDDSGGTFADTDSITLDTTGDDGAILAGVFSITDTRDIVPASGLSRDPASGAHSLFILYSTTDAGTGGLKTFGASFTSMWAVRTSGVALRAAGGSGPQIIPVGQTTETDTALGVTRRKTKTVGQATETDTALGVALRRKVRTVGQALETDSALPAAGTATVVVGLATETDSAFSATRRKTETVGQAAETDSALSATRRKTEVVGLATETDSALAATSHKAVDIEQATVADTALPATVGDGDGQTVITGLATETDTAQPVSWAKRLVAALATETDTALSARPNSIYTVGLATETDSAHSLALRRKARIVGFAQELNFALGLIDQDGGDGQGLTIEGIGIEGEGVEGEAIEG